jgi:hypothetical protein
MSTEETIKDLQDEFAEFQRLENGILSDKSPITKIINKHLGSGLYSSELILDNMTKELEDYLRRLINKTNIKGKLLGQSALDKFMDKMEMKQLTAKKLAQISRLNAEQAARRANIALMNLEKNKVVFQKDIEILRETMKLSQFNDKEILTLMVKADKEGAGLAQVFEKNIKKLSVEAVRREKAFAEIEEYRKFADPDEDWQWITVSTTPCPDCQARAGVILKYNEWVNQGLPGAGRTVCANSCKCKLVPYSIAEEKFPELKQFKWDKEKLVLTTAGEARTFKAKSNQPKQTNK